MTTRTPTRGVAAGWTGLLALTAVSACGSWLLGLRLLAVVPRTTDVAAAARVEDWILLAVLVGGLLVALWMLVGSLAGLAFAGSARRRSDPGAVDALGSWAPALVRRLARGAVGLGVGAGLALTPIAATAATASDDAPAPSVAVVELGWQSTAGDQGAVPAATEATSSPPSTADPSIEVDVDVDVDDAVHEIEAPKAEKPVVAPTEDAERPLEAQRTSHAVTTVAPDRISDEVVVVRGDTLWDIAARTLPDDAGGAEIMRETVRWHEANHDVIGDDPDLILPGQVLRSP